MSDTSAWDTGTNAEALRRVHIIDDLLGAVLLLAAAALAVALELTRRQVCAVYQLAFALCASWAFFIVGGLVDHHVSDDQLSRALYGSYVSSTHYTYVPIAASVLLSLALVLQLSSCTGCECCCTLSAARIPTSSPSTSNSAHSQCFETRVRSQASLYVGSVVALFVAIGARLNVRLRESAIHPIGGTVHWTMLRSPCYLSVIHSSALVLIALKLFLQHADTKPLDSDSHGQRLASLASLPLGPKAVAAQAAAVDDLVRSSLGAKPRRSIEASKSTLPRSPRSTSSLLSTLSSETSGSNSSTSKRLPVEPSRHAPVSRDGDVSSLISSDSENDDDVLQPSFKSGGVVVPPLHLQHTRLGLKTRAASSNKLIQSSSLSPPVSPVSTASSSSAFSFSSIASSAAAAARQQQQQRTRTARPRSTSSVSSTSTMHLVSRSDSDERSAAFEHRRSAASRAFADDRPVSASTLTSFGLRRRGGAQVLTLHPSSARESEWLECLDHVSGRVYYYNQVTGESRWER